MEPHQEAAFQKHLNSLPKQDLDTHKAHADAATDENHPSFKRVASVTAKVLGVPVTAGIVWKAIKMIKGVAKK